MDLDFYSVPVYVITCEQDKDRQKITKQRLDDEGISFEWFPASDASMMKKEDFEKENITIPWENDKGSCGVALSHIRLWRKMVEEDIDRMIVFEDDVIFHEKFKERLPFFWNSTPKDNVMVYMGYCCYWGPMGSSFVTENIPLAIHAYYITKPVAKWFLDNIGEVHEHIDIHMRNMYYSSEISREWKCYVWWEGALRSPLHNQTRLGVCFNGLILQDHNLKNAITRE